MMMTTTGALLVFRASTRGDRYAIEVWEQPDGTHKARYLTNGREAGASTGFTHAMIVKRVRDEIRDAASIDGIHYIVRYDDLGLTTGAAMAMQENPTRPPKQWFKRCERGVASKGGAIDPGAVCGAVWQRKTKKQKTSLVRAEKRASEENPTGAETALIVIGVVAGVAAVGGVGWWLWKKKKASAQSSTPTNPTQMKCPDGSMQTDCTGHMNTQPNTQTAWTPMDAAMTFAYGKTYRASFTGDVSQLTPLAPYLRGATPYDVPGGPATPADWPNATDANDPGRVRFQATGFTDGVPLSLALGIVPTLKVWVKS